MKKLSAVTWRDQKKLLITKLLTNVNFVIFNKKVFLVKILISLHRRKVFLPRFRENHKTTAFNVFWLEYVLKNLPARVLIKFAMYYDMQENFLYDFQHILSKKTSAQGVGFRWWDAIDIEQSQSLVSRLESIQYFHLRWYLYSFFFFLNNSKAYLEPC